MNYKRLNSRFTVPLNSFCFSQVIESNFTPSHFTSNGTNGRHAPPDAMLWGWHEITSLAFLPESMIWIWLQGNIKLKLRNILENNWFTLLKVL